MPNLVQKVLHDRTKRKSRKKGQGPTQQDGTENQRAEGRRISWKRTGRGGPTALGSEAAGQGQRQGRQPVALAVFPGQLPDTSETRSTVLQLRKVELNSSVV